MKDFFINLRCGYKDKFRGKNTHPSPINGASEYHLKFHPLLLGCSHSLDSNQRIEKIPNIQNHPEIASRSMEAAIYWMYASFDRFTSTSLSEKLSSKIWIPDASAAG